MDEKTQKTPPQGSMLARIDHLEAKAKKQRSGKKDTKSVTEDRIAKALVDLRRSHSDDPALADFREDLFNELRKLIKPAIAQAKKGKPALLRILTRYSR